MFNFLNTLFQENGFTKIAYDEMNSLTAADGPFHWIYDGKGYSLFGYLDRYDGDQSTDPEYDSYKDSKLKIYVNDPERTVSENLNDNMIKLHFKKDNIEKIQKDYDEASQAILEVRKTGKNFKPVVKTIAEEIAYFKREFPLRTWANDIPYVADEIHKIEKSFLNKYGEILSKDVFPNSSPLSKPLKWFGSLPELCRFFYFAGKDHYKETGTLCYFNATREEIEEFIFKNFLDAQGNKFSKGNITKIFNPNDHRMNATHKKYFNNVRKLDMPADSSTEE